MVNVAQIIIGGIALGLIAGGAYLMNMFFGLVGVGLFVGMTVCTILLVAFLSGGGNSGSGNVSAGNRRSKGARSRED